ncbi:hypothetical protein [Enterococcus rivorum]|uniref:hypothetical protein n=1 Tax=Enterococcus rivorum TaxID=762845 RepID=UPI00363CBDB8
MGDSFFLIVCGFIHFGKYEEQQSKMLMTLPINKTSILLGDTILFFFHSMLMLSFMLIFCYLFGYIFGEVVPFDYPIIVRNADKIVLIPVYKVVLYLCFLFLLVLNAMFQLSVTAMFLVKKTFLAIFVSSLCVLLISIFFQRTTIIGEVFSSYNPFTYTSPFDLFVGISNEVIDTVQANASSLTYNNVDYYSGLTLVALNKNIDVFKGGISLFMTFSGLFIINNFFNQTNKILKESGKWY